MTTHHITCATCYLCGFLSTSGSPAWDYSALVPFNRKHMFTADKKNPEVWILLEKEQLRDLVI